MKYLILPITLLFVLTATVSGHGVGQTIEKSVGNYIIALDYNSLSSEIETQTSMRFDIDISDKDGEGVTDFTDVWVTIAAMNSFDNIFAGNINQSELGATGFTFTFPKADTYEITVRFQKNGKPLHEEVSFPLTVIEGTTENPPRDWYNPTFMVTVGAIAGFVISLLFKKKS